MKKGMQKLVYAIIRDACVEYGDKYIIRTDIIKQVAKTSYGALERVVLVQKVEQAIYQLRNKMMIFSKGYGRWGIPKKDNPYNNKYQPRLCQALQKRDKGWYCPVQEMYIGNPALQCELIHDFDGEAKIVYPMKKCYFRSKPTEEEIEYTQQKITNMNSLKTKEIEDFYQNRVRGF